MSTKKAKVEDDARRYSDDDVSVGACILLVIDTGYLVSKVPAGGTLRKPITRGVPKACSAFYSTPWGVARGQGELNANLYATVGDGFSVRVADVFQNSSDAVLLCGVEENGVRKVFESFAMKVHDVPHAAVPDPSLRPSGGLPPQLIELPFSKATSTSVRSGQAKLTLCFGLYQLNSSMQTQVLRGYYACSLKLKLTLPGKPSPKR